MSGVYGKPGQPGPEGVPGLPGVTGPSGNDGRRGRIGTVGLPGAPVSAYSEIIYSLTRFLLTWRVLKRYKWQLKLAKIKLWKWDILYIDWDLYPGTWINGSKKNIMEWEEYFMSY